jgi:hypothetical protein
MKRIGWKTKFWGSEHNSEAALPKTTAQPHCVDEDQAHYCALLFLGVLNRRCCTIDEQPCASLMSLSNGMRAGRAMTRTVAFTEPKAHPTKPGPL